VCLSVSGAANAEPTVGSSLPTCTWNPHQISSLQRSAPATCFDAGVVFLRENTLPICDWGDPARSYLQLIQTSDGQPGAFECVNLTIGASCTIRNGRPRDAIYWLLGPDTMAWANGGALYGVREFACTLNRTGTPVDHLIEQSIVGLDAVEACSTEPAHAAVLTELDGGVVEHVRPAAVRGQALLRVDNSSPAGRSATATLAIQVFTNGAWIDHAITQFPITGTLTLYEVQDEVSPGMDVRLQVRGTTCEGGDVLADARIQVETCIPDQSNPGSCL
jgi:hypothetical protein